MSNPILVKESLIPGQTSKLVIAAAPIAAKARPGNFVILRLSDKGERIPLTIADTDPDQGTITLVYLVLGKTTAELESLKPGDSILDLCGPLGKPTDIHPVKGQVICIGGGTGIAAMHHIAKGHVRAGNNVQTIIGARSQNLLLFEDELKNLCQDGLVCTDDGSYGLKGLVTEPLLEKLKNPVEPIAEVIAVGPVPMMRAVAETTRPFGIKTVVSLNSIMLDGVGMCGACRVTVAGQTRFTCVDGPEFDGHQVDFDELAHRLRAFKTEEALSYNQYKQSCGCASK